MSSKSDEDQVIVEKMKNYRELTVVNDSPITKQLVSTQNAITVSPPPLNIITSRPNHPISIVPTSSSQNFIETYTTCSELRQAVERNKLPPYTNVPTCQTPNRITRIPQSRTPPKSYLSQKFVPPEKPISEATISTPIILHSKSVTVENVTNENFNPVPVPWPQSKSDKVALIATTSVMNETNSSTPKTFQEQTMQHHSSKSSNDILERNIHNKVISLTPSSLNMKPTTPPKETKVLPVTTISKAISTSPTPTITVPVKENPNFNSPPKSDVPTTQPNTATKSASTNNTSKAVKTSSTELPPKSILPKSSIENNVISPSKMKDVATTVSSTECNSRSVDLNSRNIPPKIVPSTISSCISRINPKTTTISVSTGTASPLPKKCVFTEAIQVAAVPPPLPRGMISSISENKALMDALNSGSNVNLTDSVTISNNTVQLMVVQTGTDTKIGNTGSETTVQPISKSIHGVIPPSSAGPFRKGGSSEIVGGGNPSPSGSSPKESSSPNASRDLRSSRHKDSISFIRKSPVENEDIGVETRRRTLPEATQVDVERSDNLGAQRKIEEPECLTISSDEEETEEAENAVSSYSDTSIISTSISNKEPPLIDAYDDAKLSDSELNMCDKESVSELDATSGPGYTNLNCRTVRIGSYKFLPLTPVTISEYGVRMVVPAINRPAESVVVKIPMEGIIKVLIHSGRQLPVIFYYVSAQIGAKVRRLLKMTNKNECYFNPFSKDESQRRITLVLEKFSESSGSCITELYLDRDLLDELNYREANALLVKSSPRERKDMQKIMKQVPSNPVQTIMVYPPPPARGGISINTEDYSCLAEDVFLNDVIIDFYLKWLYNEKLSPEDREKTHIFSSFFYKRLTDKATPMPRDLHNTRSTDTTISPAEIRHSRVSKWTKNINLFSKDYIIIPLNENQHWFLAIICFPGMSGPVRFADNQPIELQQPEMKIESADSSSENVDSQTIFIGSTSITPIRQDLVTKYAIAEEEGGDADERDEADGAEEDVNLYLPTSEDSDADFSESELTSSGDVKPSLSRIKTEKEPIKQPCILVFDSLAGASRARIIATLRDYLRVEYKAKHNEERDFSKAVVKGACPRVPQQNNYTDCGLFVLQYVESFFVNKITDFHVPIRSLRNWFDPDIVGRKRFEIQQLLLRLMRDQDIDIDCLNLPRLNLSQQTDESSEYYEDDFYDDDDDDDDDDELGLDDEDIETDDVEGDLDHPFDYQSMAELDEELAEVEEETGTTATFRRSFQGNYRRSYRRHHQDDVDDEDDDDDENNDHLRDHHRHRHRYPHPHNRQSGEKVEYLDDGEDLESYDDVAARHRFELYGAEFDMDNEDSHGGADGNNDSINEADIYHDLDNIDVMKTRTRATNAASSIVANRCRTRAVTTTSKCHMGRPLSRKATLRRVQSNQIVDYDEDDDRDNHDAVEGMEEEVGVDDADDDELGALHHVVDDEEEEDVEGLNAIIEGDEEGEVDEESVQFPLANERLCGLNPETVTISRAVSVTRRRLPAAAKDLNQSSSSISTTGAGDGGSLILERSQLAALKAARPFGDVESSDSASPSNKKFRSN